MKTQGDQRLKPLELKQKTVCLAFMGSLALDQDLQCHKPTLDGSCISAMLKRQWPLWSSAMVKRVRYYTVAQGKVLLRILDFWRFDMQVML